MNDTGPSYPEGYPADCEVLAAMREKAGSRAAGRPVERGYEPRLLVARAAQSHRMRIVYLNIPNDFVA